MTIAQVLKSKVYKVCLKKDTTHRHTTLETYVPGRACASADISLGRFRERPRCYVPKPLSWLVTAPEKPTLPTFEGSIWFHVHGGAQGWFTLFNSAPKTGEHLWIT